MPIVALAALHGGCYELFVNDRVRAIRDLKGRRVAVSAMDALEYYYVASMAAYVGLDPLKDIEWVDTKSFEGVLNAFMEARQTPFWRSRRNRKSCVQRRSAESSSIRPSTVRGPSTSAA